MDRSSPTAVARAGSLRNMHSDSTRRYALRPRELRHVPNLPAGGIRSGRPSHSACAKPPAPGDPISSSRDRLKFCRRRSVKSSPCLLKKCTHVVGLENIAAKENTSCSRGRNVTDHIERVFVRGMTASAKHQDWYGTSFHHRTHGGYIPAVIRLNSIRAQLGCHASVEVQPLGIAWILHILPPCKRFHNQRDSNPLTFAGDFRVARDFLHLELGITRTYNKIGENSVCAVS